jgi:hypothetical protein
MAGRGGANGHFGPIYEACQSISRVCEPNEMPVIFRPVNSPAICEFRNQKNCKYLPKNDLQMTGVVY